MIKALSLGNYTAAQLVGDAQIFSANQFGCDAITGVLFTKNAGTGFDVTIQVSNDGITWFQFGAIDEATTDLAISLGRGYGMIRFVIVEGTDDMDIDIKIVGHRKKLKGMPIRQIHLGTIDTVSASASYESNAMGSDVLTSLMLVDVAGTWTIQVQVSIDGSTWTTIAGLTNASVNLAVSLGEGFPHARINMSAESSGDVTIYGTVMKAA